MTVCLLALQITLYLGKRDFVDHVDSVEVVGMSCSVHALKRGSCVKTDATVFLPMCRGRRQGGPFWPRRQERYLNPKHVCTPWTLTASPSLQCTSTSPAPSATEAKTWTWWGCPSGGTSGSSVSRSTLPRGRTQPRHPCRNSSWRRSESRDTLFPFRSEGVACLWFHAHFQIKSRMRLPEIHLFCWIDF